MALRHQALYPQMTGKGPFTVEVPGIEKKDGETIPRRHPVAKDGLITSPGEGVQTVYDLFKRGSANFGNAKALGSRKIITTHVETKKVKKDGKEVNKKWTYFELGGYDYMSYVEYEKLVLQLGSGLRQIGMQKGDIIHLFAATHPHWLAMSHGAASQSMPMATAYDTLGADGLKHSMVQTGSKAIFCDPHLVATLEKPLAEATNLTYIIYNTTGDAPTKAIETLKSKYDRLTILSVEELRKRGEQNMVDTVPPTREDLCCIMYTSGSTGPPKGVPLKHKNVIASVAGVTTIIGQYIGPGDGLLTYLPLAHILEFVFENAVLFWGGTMGYGNPKTLSDTSVRNCKGDIREFRPTILVGVPAVWESIKKGIVAKVDKSGPIVKNIFWTALSTKSFLMSSGIPGSGVLDAVAFRKIKDATGGRLKICMNGGGPISRDTQNFISMAIAPMISGYGLTETTAMGALCDPKHFTLDALGDIPSSIEVKLVDYPEAGYYSTNKPPQGEIWIRGDPVITEYFKNEQETQAAMAGDGWFMTGDVGEFDHHGQLNIIDRKKNLVKTLNGEYIALEKLESIYRSSKLVANICVYASPEQAKPVAIIVPAEPALKQLAKNIGIKDDHLESLVENEKVQKAVLKELQDAGRQGGLDNIEIIEGVALSGEEWTAENGLLTAATKIQRRPILQKFQKEVDKAYGKK